MTKNLYRLTITKPPSLTEHRANFRSCSVDAAIQEFSIAHQGWLVWACEPVNEQEPCTCQKVCNKQKSPKRLRTTYKARLTGIRNNLQSMVEADDQLLTEEELLQLGRTICKLNRVLGLFIMRTMDLQREGKLDDKGTP